MWCKPYLDAWVLWQHAQWAWLQSWAVWRVSKQAWTTEWLTSRRSPPDHQYLTERTRLEFNISGVIRDGYNRDTFMKESWITPYYQNAFAMNSLTATYSFFIFFSKVKKKNLNNKFQTSYMSIYIVCVCASVCDKCISLTGELGLKTLFHH